MNTNPPLPSKTISSVIMIGHYLICTNKWDKTSPVLSNKLNLACAEIKIQNFVGACFTTPCVNDVKSVPMIRKPCPR